METPLSSSDDKCRTLRERTEIDPGSLIIQLDCRRKERLAARNMPTKPDELIEELLTWTTDDGKKLFLGRDKARKCPCDNELILLKTNPDVPVAGREGAAKKEDSRASDYLQSNLLFPFEPEQEKRDVKPSACRGKEFSRSGNNALKVAVVDSGLDVEHDLLKPVLWPNTDPINDCSEIDGPYGYDFFAKDAGISDPSGHGTHIAGTIAARSFPMALLGLKVSGKEKEQAPARLDLFSILCAMKFAIKNKVKIINCSWGYYAPSPSPFLRDVIEEAEANGIMIVAAAGNDNQNIDTCPYWPCSFSRSYYNVIGVGAYDGQSTALPEFTNHGSTVQLFASGTHILSTVPGNLCQARSGTSMAAAIVSGQLAQFIEYGVPFEDLRSKLRNLSISLNGATDKISEWDRYLTFKGSLCT